MGRVPPSGAAQPMGAAQPGPARRRRGIGLAVLAVGLAAAIGFAPVLPSLNGVGAAWTSFLPWSAALISLLAIVATLRRAWIGLIAVLVAAIVWSVMFVPRLIPTAAAGGAADLVVATQNVGVGNPDPVTTLNSVAAAGAGLLAVQEIAGPSGEAAARTLDAQFADSARVGTVGLWSRWPLGTVKPLKLGFDFARALRVPVQHPSGELVAYVVHLPSVRPGDTAARDAAVEELSGLIQAESASRVLVMGDLNTATTDPTFGVLTAELADSRTTVNGGFGFSWPAALPMTRPDHVLSRGLTAVSDEVVDTGGSDHLAVVAGLRFGA